MAPKRKLTPEQEDHIRRNVEGGATQAYCSQVFYVPQSVISKIIAEGKTAKAAPKQPDGMIMLRWDQLLPSPLNPRRAFDEAALDELADSIAEQGLLQNLVVRRAMKRDQYIIVAGERRYRAIDRLIKQKRWIGPIVCRVVEADQNTHLALALLENLQRVDLAPLEEAEGFVKLHEMAMTTATIAAKIGRTQRYVQQRMVLATKLIPAGRTLLSDGRITIEAARTLAAVEPDIQQHIINECDAMGQLQFLNAEFITREAEFFTRPKKRHTFPVEPEQFAQDLEETEQRIAREFPDLNPPASLPDTAPAMVPEPLPMPRKPPAGMKPTNKNYWTCGTCHQLVPISTWRGA